MTTLITALPTPPGLQRGRSFWLEWGCFPMTRDRVYVQNHLRLAQLEVLGCWWWWQLGKKTLSDMTSVGVVHAAAGVPGAMIAYSKFLP